MNNIFGENLKRIREDKGYSQEYIAKSINICRESVSKWETGKASPQVKWLYAIAEVLEVNPSELVRTL